MNEQAKQFIQWLQEQASTEGKCSRAWAAAGAHDNEHYRAGACNAFLEVIDYVERHPGLLHD